MWKAIKKDFFRGKKKEIQWLVDTWLNTVKPALKKTHYIIPKRYPEIDMEDRIVIGFLSRLNDILVDSTWRITINDKNMLEREHIIDSDDFLGIQDIFLDFIEAIFENTEIQRCKHKECRNIFLKLTNPESRNKRYCSDKCSEEAKKERDRDTVNENAEPIHQVLNDLIKILVERWQKENEYNRFLEKGITASKLIDEFEDLLKDKRQNYMKREGKYYKNGVEITFLGENRNTVSLGKLLLEKEKKQHSILVKPNQNIIIEVKKRKPINRYCFPITQAKEITPDANSQTYEEFYPPPKILEMDILEESVPVFDKKMIDELKKRATNNPIKPMILTSEELIKLMQKKP